MGRGAARGRVKFIWVRRGTAIAYAALIISGGAPVAAPALAIEPGLDGVDMATAEPRVLSRLLKLPLKLPRELGNPNSLRPSRMRPKASPGSTALGKTDATVITLVAVGDTGLNAHMARVRPGGGYKHGGFIPWARATRDIRHEINGDINFMNLETVVTASNKHRRENKSFNFRMHPGGARHLTKIGFNLFSTANNHSMDFAAAGARATLKHLEKLGEDAGLLAWPGLGQGREDAGRPWPMDIKNTRIMASALGITTGSFPSHRAGETRIGQMSYQSKSDFAAVTQRLSKAPASYKILSVHYGIERDVRVDRSERRKLSAIAVGEAGVDLVLGHHAHVARGVELRGGKVVIYGLGNFLHFGTANMAPQGLCRDYGLLAKLHLLKRPNGKLEMRAIQVLPLTNMHRQTRVMKPAKARKRVYVLNHLAKALDNKGSGARGVRFTPQNDGSGLYCVSGSAGDPGVIGKLCKAWQPAKAAPKSLARQIAGSCRRVSRSYAQNAKKRRVRRAKRKRKAKQAKSFFSQIFGD